MTLHSTYNFVGHWQPLPPPGGPEGKGTVAVYHCVSRVQQRARHKMGLNEQ